ncbi:hypothetical protein PHMEG_00031163 [Phytophthora megakarya]|uniref:Uncharacterized protein n=1 Tax=Phytophthora megakarya TaxID=4795 RepID=A0A225V120_9STRA|nr:hypothetical protein PHMEG_00031163 [Phytophthora megakarya]
MAEYSGMNHGVIAALELSHRWRLEVSNLAITWGDRMPERFADDTPEPPPRSLRYLHVVREYYAAADSLAGEVLESKVSKVVLNDHRTTELKELNRNQEIIYEPSSDEQNPRSDL